MWVAGQLSNGAAAASVWATVGAQAGPGLVLVS
jgi:hypothetical protein